MNAYASDHEQWELIKSWWKTNGKMLVLVVVIAMAATYGFRYWQQARTHKFQEASMLYEQLLASQIQNTQPSVAALSKTLQSQYKNTPYASLSALFEAKNAADKNQLGLVEQKLNWVLANGSSNSLKQIARLRLARVLLAENKAQEAIILLNTVDEKGYDAAINLIKAQAFEKLGNSASAAELYQAAIKDIPRDQPIYSFVEMQQNQFPKVK